MIEKYNTDSFDTSVGGCCDFNYFKGSSRTYVFLSNDFIFPNVDTQSEIYGVKRLKADRRCLSTATYITGPWQRNWRSLGDNSSVNSIPVISGYKNSIECSNLIENTTNPETYDGLAIQDRIEWFCEQSHINHEMTHFDGWGVSYWNSPLMWRDNGRIYGILTPLSAAAWINCFGQPCHECVWQSKIICTEDSSGPEDMMNSLGHAIDSFWRDKERDWVPSDLFFSDWKGVMDRGAEPITGWFLYVFFGFGIACGLCGLYDEYCGCCWFCFLKHCHEPFFIKKVTGASVITLNQNRGIPYKNSDELKWFYDQMLLSKTIIKPVIELTDISNEIIFTVGRSNWTDGVIEYRKTVAPFTGLSGVFFQNGASTTTNAESVLGRLSVEREQANDSYNSDLPPKYSQELGYGKQSAVLDTSNGLTINRNTKTFLVTDSLVVNSFTQSTRQIMMDNDYYEALSIINETRRKPWIRVDVPEDIQREFSYIKYTADSNVLPDLAYGGGVPWNPVHWFAPLTRRHRKLQVKSLVGPSPARWCLFDSPKQGEKYSNKFFFKNLTDSGGLGKQIVAGKVNGDGMEEADIITYYKQCFKKYVKVPYHLVHREGDRDGFQELRLGSTYSFKPGRYYFPNPAAVNRKISTFDRDFIDLDEEDLVTNNKDFRYLFPMLYRAFKLDPDENYINYTYDDYKQLQVSLKKRFDNAVKLFGEPSVENSVLMDGNIGESNQSINEVYDFINQNAANGEPVNYDSFLEFLKLTTFV